MTSSKLGLVDTNVLVYAADEDSPYHEASKELREKCLSGQVALCISPQILTEFYAVITDIKRTLNPRTPEEALREIKKYVSSKRLIKIFPIPATNQALIHLLERYPVKRQEVFDLQLVATMLSNGVNQIYTFNQDHFKRFSEIEAVTP